MLTIQDGYETIVFMGELKMDKEKLESEIEHKKLMLHFTKRIILNPPLDEISKTMMAQAERLKAQLEELREQLQGLKKAKKVKKKQVVKKKTKVSKRSK